MTTRHNPLELYQLDNSSPDELSEKQLALFALLQQREQEFGFNPNVIVHYPEARFLSAPLDYLDQLISEQQQQGQLINEVVILTTYLQVQAPLVERGYRHETVHMPAGPDHTAIFGMQYGTQVAGKTLYVEAVNEQDPKIRPTFVLMLRDEHGELQGGMSGSIWTQDERRYAYIGTVVVQPGQPAGTGTQLANTVLEYLTQQGVYEVNLGTQTAEPFYAKLGFKVIHHIVPALRHRTASDGAELPHNLVIMSKLL
ncbi:MULTISPECIES: GNAT family N-acetyltransferase [Aeromonas]|jgi:N-acetylglutamate synthase-like GNAT family acetyltransferase|uniref:N-acetyltransferase n=1 Tax=Aeromonas veronii TaxID=654 RepID=A0A2T4N283_AERVE|nr:GNAT family N-acetyltransferase [Aeromonas veronii]AXV21219.1 N-acetyltransferase [Aeromonas veronii]MBA2796866.1 GNAT family N-acetyltransferase [Aeromonas veronii]MBL0567321.1 GNAT family N-acetyltransferase [Aeromonas veronii]MCX0443910.1 GNAT family N-acetyltransferase [Aeromonas veronii]PTH80939.1 N-acetyltransferase [Aeromonas veronii]